jgi:DNA repair photolyase
VSEVKKREMSWIEARDAVVATMVCPYCFTTQSPKFMDWHKYTEHECPIPAGKSLADIAPKEHALYQDGELIVIGSVSDAYGD